MDYLELAIKLSIIIGGLSLFVIAIAVCYLAHREYQDNKEHEYNKAMFIQSVKKWDENRREDDGKKD